MRIQDIEVIPLNLRLHADIAPHLNRSSHTGRLYLYRIELEDGTVGYGEETIADQNDAEAVRALIGQNALAGLHTIRHSGVQMACYDAVGKSLGAPAHVLMGEQHHMEVPFAYWTIDLPPETLVAQTERAVSLDYHNYKYKCRPWWDPVEQMERVAKIVPATFRFWLDFNGHLRNVEQALPVLQELAQFDCVGGFESPIPQRDATGYQALRHQIGKPIAAHYGSGCCHVRSDPNFDPGVPALRQINEGLCDGFVLGGSDVPTIQRRAAVAAEAGLPFWIQSVGAGLRAAWVAHLASTCEMGTWTHLAAHDVWFQDIAAVPAPNAGMFAVPDQPGLGVKLIDDVIASYQGEDPPAQPRRISTVIHVDGSRIHFATEQQRHEAFYFGHYPGFQRGVRLDVQEDDGSPDFDELWQRCNVEPITTATAHF